MNDRGLSVEEVDPDRSVVTLSARLRPTTPRLDLRVADARDDGVRYLVVLDRENHLLAVAGWRALMTSRGRVMHIDDLITDPAHRHQGAASVLLAHLDELFRMRSVVIGGQ